MRRSTAPCSVLGLRMPQSNIPFALRIQWLITQREMSILISVVLYAVGCAQTLSRERLLLYDDRNEWRQELAF